MDIDGQDTDLDPSDYIICEYNDGSGWVALTNGTQYDNFGTATATANIPPASTTLLLRVRALNPTSGSNEDYFLDNISITGTPIVTVNDPTDLAIDGGTPTTVTFTGTGATTYLWTNNNSNINLGASGVGDISFTAANVSTTQVATIEVTPSNGTCAGTPQTFTITVTVPCINPTAGGTITADEIICSGGDPVAFASTAGASGETGTLQYKWQSSTTGSGSGFNDIDGATGLTYDAPAGLTLTTWYKRLARVDCKTDWTGAAESNVLAVTVYVPSISIQPGTVTPVCQSAQETTTSLYYDAVTGNPDSYEILWSNEATAAGFQDQVVHNFTFEQNGGFLDNIQVPANVSAGTYNADVVVYSGELCTSERVGITLIVSAPINFTSTPVINNSPLCADQDLYLKAPDGGLSYSWTNSNGVSVGNVNEITVSSNEVIPGFYKLAVYNACANPNNPWDSYKRQIPVSMVKKPLFYNYSNRTAEAPSDACETPVDYSLTLSTESPLAVDQTVDHLNISSPTILHYTISLSNTGEPNGLYSLTVFGSLSGDAAYSTGDNGNGALDLNETWIYTGSFLVTQDLINAGQP